MLGKVQQVEAKLVRGQLEGIKTSRRIAVRARGIVFIQQLGRERGPRGCSQRVVLEHTRKDVLLFSNAESDDVT